MLDSSALVGVNHPSFDQTWRSSAESGYTVHVRDDFAQTDLELVS